MHPAHLYYPIHSAAPCSLGELLLPLGGFHRQPQSLHCTIKLRYHFQEVIHQKYAERSTLRRLGYFGAPSQQDGPIRRGRKHGAVRSIFKKP